MPTNPTIAAEGAAGLVRRRARACGDARRLLLDRLGDPDRRASRRLREHAAARPGGAERPRRRRRRPPRSRGRQRNGRPAPDQGDLHGRHIRPRRRRPVEPSRCRRQRAACEPGLRGDRLHRRLRLGRDPLLAPDHQRGAHPPGLAGQLRRRPGAAVPGRRRPDPRGGPANRAADLRPRDPERRGAGRRRSSVGEAAAFAGRHGGWRPPAFDAVMASAFRERARAIGVRISPAGPDDLGYAAVDAPGGAGGCRTAQGRVRRVIVDGRAVRDARYRGLPVRRSGSSRPPPRTRRSCRPPASGS